MSRRKEIRVTDPTLSNSGTQSHLTPILVDNNAYSSFKIINRKNDNQNNPTVNNLCVWEISSKSAAQKHIRDGAAEFDPSLTAA